MVNRRQLSSPLLRKVPEQFLPVFFRFGGTGTRRLPQRGNGVDTKVPVVLLIGFESNILAVAGKDLVEDYDYGSKIRSKD
ncbi:MAG: hypothetical protein K9M45_13235 [Kiritimatiellales bacterium]|nr:hypothetical protein [Kiritimatiellales bacterium]